MVHLTKIYTRTGDQGTTRLSDNAQVDKFDSRVMAYGDVDEANSILGVALASGGLQDATVAILQQVQHELFDVGADLSTPIDPEASIEPLRITGPAVDRLEHWCDQMGDSLPPLRSFILPTGPRPAVAFLHLARTVLRRAERQGWAAANEVGLDGAGGISAVALRYLNRLSDLLFILARAEATSGGEDADGETLWVPGASRQHH